MQIVVVAPEATSVAARSNAELTKEICGVGLLERTLVTAQRAGASEVLLVWPQSLPLELAEGTLRSRLLKKKDTVRLVQVEHFDPNACSSWTNLQSQLEEQFIWLPWNWVTYARALARLPELKQSSPDWDGPTWASKTAVVSAAIPRPRIGPVPEGVAVISDDTAAAAERLLVARSGKVLDGIHTSFNRWLCRPAVRWLAHTPATPNQVTFGGVVVAILAGIVLARGTYWSYVGGALLFYIAGLFDEMDGMLARIKFADSPMGTWLEGFADGLSYLLLFGGITIGLSRQHGRWELWLGAALFVGTALSLVVTNFQRKRATTADRPNEYLGKFYRMLEDDKSNWISRQVRQLHAFLKRGVLIIYVVIFAFLNLVPLLFYLAILGSHITWMIVLYYNHKFVKRPSASDPRRRIQPSQEAS
jgi:phosphatidylglycerophosphate synthase